MKAFNLLCRYYNYWISTEKEEQEKINMRRQEFWNELEQIEVFRKIRQEGGEMGENNYPETYLQRPQRLTRQQMVMEFMNRKERIGWFSTPSNSMFGKKVQIGEYLNSLGQHWRMGSRL